MEDGDGTGDRSHLPEGVETAEATIRAIRRRADRIKRRELRTAKRRFEAGGPMTDTQEEILERTADRLVDSLLAEPERRLERVAETETDGKDTIAAVAELFDG